MCMKSSDFLEYAIEAGSSIHRALLYLISSMNSILFRICLRLHQFIEAACLIAHNFPLKIPSVYN